MKRLLRVIVFVLALCILITPFTVNAENDSTDASFEKPDYVYSIARENTHENMMRELPYLEPAELTKKLQESSDVQIDNPTLISMLNESTIKESKVAIGVNASVYLGSWALTYDSEGTEVNWEYEKINTNEVDNRGGESAAKLKYLQTQNKQIEGELSSPVPQQEDVQNLMRIEATRKTSLPLSFNTHIGEQTTAGPNYQVQSNQRGVVQGYVPAVHDQGTVTYGEVYLEMKGTKQSISVKNIEKQKVDGWLPVKDFVTLKYNNG